MNDTTTNGVIVWFRRDLRIHNNPALSAALESGLPILPIYIHDTDAEPGWSPGAASRWWLHHSLQQLSEALHKINLQLHYFRGDTSQILSDLVKTEKISRIHWNNLYEPGIRRLDDSIGTSLPSVDLQRFDSHLLFIPGTLLNKQQKPYRVFTPFWKTARAQLETRGVSLAMSAQKGKGIANNENIKQACKLDDLGLLDKYPWHKKLQQHWQPGEQHAHALLADFLDKRISNYDHDRDFPSVNGTSRLSPYLHFGEITAAQIFYEVQQREFSSSEQTSVERLFTELGWREFAHHVLWHFPHTVMQPMNPKFVSLWPKHEDKKLLTAWQTGQTGIALVDAGMRQLWETGWMHNRVRMVVGSLLTKNLGIHWLHGARWFWDTLVDADLASNTLGWQWVAGCGVDAAPYYRIFNPDTQATRFDSGSEYIRRWVTEVDDINSLTPVVELKTSREEALQRYKTV